MNVSMDGANLLDKLKYILKRIVSECYEQSSFETVYQSILADVLITLEKHRAIPRGNHNYDFIGEQVLNFDPSKYRSIPFQVFSEHLVSSSIQNQILMETVSDLNKEPEIDKNFCYNDNGCSKCSKKEKEDWPDQKLCKFYKKASFRDRCMYLKYEEYCDNVEAQKNAGKRK
jgi:hypothetical protein